MNIFMYVKKKKKIFFGTNDPNKCEWGGMFPNFINNCFYGILFDHHFTFRLEVHRFHATG